MKIKLFIFAAVILGLFSYTIESNMPHDQHYSGFYKHWRIHPNSRQQASEEVSTQNPTKNSEILSGTGKTNPFEKTPNISLPVSVNLDIPFQPQAPFGNWDLPYKEACEEAATIMVNAYFNISPLTAETMNTEILKLIEWEKKTLGHYQEDKCD